MKDFNRPNKFSGNKGGGSFNRGGARPGFKREDRPAFKTTCDNCHKDCEVPFKPNGSKPVYCRDCFNSKREDNSNTQPTKEFGFAPSPSKQIPTENSHDLKRQIEAINLKIDKILQILSPQIQTAPKESTEIENVAKKPASTKKVVAKKKTTPKKK